MQVCVLPHLMLACHVAAKAEAEAKAKAEADAEAETEAETNAAAANWEAVVWLQLLL